MVQKALPGQFRPPHALRHLVKASARLQQEGGKSRIGPNADLKLIDVSACVRAECREAIFIDSR